MRTGILSARYCSGIRRERNAGQLRPIALTRAEAAAGGAPAPGRRPYAAFAAAVDAVLAAGVHKTAVMTPEEHRALVAERCRNGSVEAMRLYWRMLVADLTRTSQQPAVKDPLAELDELSQRRRGRGRDR